MTPEQRAAIDAARRGGPSPTPSGRPGADPPSDQPGYLGQFWSGIKRGASGNVVGAEQGLAGLGMKGMAPSQADLDYVDPKQDRGWAETGGRWLGAAAPYALTAIPGGGLGALAARAAIGGVAGFSQPTKSGSLSSHGWDAAAGMLTGLMPYAPKWLLESGDSLSAWAASYAARGAFGGEFWEWPLYDALRRMGLVSKVAQGAKYAPAGATGAEAGKAAQKVQEMTGQDTSRPQPPQQ